jgi:hypothetical protein
LDTLDFSQKLDHRELAISKSPNKGMNGMCDGFQTSSQAKRDKKTLAINFSVMVYRRFSLRYAMLWIFTGLFTARKNATFSGVEYILHIALN